MLVAVVGDLRRTHTTTVRSIASRKVSFAILITRATSALPQSPGSGKRCSQLSENRNDSAINRAAKNALRKREVRLTARDRHATTAPIAITDARKARGQGQARRNARNRRRHSANGRNTLNHPLRNAVHARMSRLSAARLSLRRRTRADALTLLSVPRARGMKQDARRKPRRSRGTIAARWRNSSTNNVSMS